METFIWKRGGGEERRVRYDDEFGSIKSPSSALTMDGAGIESVNEIQGVAGLGPGSRGQVRDGGKALWSKIEKNTDKIAIPRARE